LLSKTENIVSVSIEMSPSDMNYQPPKALQEQTKNSAITPAIQNKFEFDSKQVVEKSVMKLVFPNFQIFGINLFPVFLSNERFVFWTRFL
jgi:transcriptional accessory protein Tex/SPT6